MSSYFRQEWAFWSNLFAEYQCQLIEEDWEAKQWLIEVQNIPKKKRLFSKNFFKGPATNEEFPKRGMCNTCQKTTLSKIFYKGPPQIRNSRKVLPQMENSWNGPATNREFPKCVTTNQQQMENSWNGPAANPEVPKCASTNQEYLKCDSRFLVSHFKNSPFVVALFGNSWFVAGPYKRF